jgi:hypothetical protein
MAIRHELLNYYYCAVAISETMCVCVCGRCHILTQVYIYSHRYIYIYCFLVITSTLFSNDQNPMGTFLPPSLSTSLSMCMCACYIHTTRKARSATHTQRDHYHGVRRQPGLPANIASRLFDHAMPCHAMSCDQTINHINSSGGAVGKRPRSSVESPFIFILPRRCGERSNAM